MDGAKDQKILNLFRNPIQVEVFVGRGHALTKWSLPQKLLCRYSRFFDKTGDSADPVSVTLSEDDPDAFEMFVQWLLIGGGAIETSKMTSSHRYLQAWILGQKLKCPVFQDYVMLHLLKYHKDPIAEPRDPFSPESLEKVCKETVSGSRLRDWAIHQFLYDSIKRPIYYTAGEWARVIHASHDIEKDVLDSLMNLGPAAAEAPCQQSSKYLMTCVFEK
ncbi:hypothetical protein ACLMJK_008025 [Lecanora helva]